MRLPHNRIEMLRAVLNCGNNVVIGHKKANIN